MDALPPWESVAEEIGAVMDAVGSNEAAIIAGLSAGPVGLLFAATRPERVKALGRSRKPVAPRTIGRHMAADASGAQNESHLGVGYDELEGEELVAKLSADGRLDVIEALWRFGEVTAAESVVSQLASLNDPNLSRDVPRVSWSRDS